MTGPASRRSLPTWIVIVVTPLTIPKIAPLISDDSEPSRSFDERRLLCLSARVMRQR